MHESLPTDSTTQSSTAGSTSCTFPTLPDRRGTSHSFSARLAPAVLVVDPWGDTEEVIGTVLRRHGHRTERVSSWQSLKHQRADKQAKVIVLDAELLRPGEAHEVAHELAGPSSDKQPQLVVLGKLFGPDSPPPGVLSVSKPYCVGWLVRKIEEMLADGETRQRLAPAA